MAKLVINGSELMKTVPIVLASGAKDEVFVQPKWRVEIPEDAEVDETYLHLNPQVQVQVA
jgi:hypothetical protein